ncbi:MAG: extracellular solute-binding protein [Chloroflexota bacterium]|nr:extracellular solute-binding protein [Chloroflexota bacterium]
MSRSRSPLAMVALALLLALVGAGVQTTASAQDEVTLRVWDQFTGPEGAVVDQIYESFTEQNPNVTIEREAFDTDQMRQTVNTALASGTGPDIIFYDTGPGYAGVLQEANLLLPLDPMADQYGWRERLVESALQGGSIDGQLYGLPLQIDLIGLYVNRTLMEEQGFQTPETVEQLIQLCGQASEAGLIPLAFGDQEGWPAFHQFSVTSNQMLGPDAMRQLLFEGQGSWDSPEMVTAIRTFFVEMRDAGCFGEDPNALTYDDANALFYSGQALMAPTGSWLISELEENMPDQDVALVPFPAISGGQGSVWVSGLGSAYYVSANSQHQEQAGRFLDFLFSPETAQRWVGEADFFVPVEVDTAALELSPLARSVFDVLQAAAAGQTPLGYNIDVLTPPEFNDTMLNGFQAILAGDKTPEQQAADLQAAWLAAAPGAAVPQS